MAKPRKPVEAVTGSYTALPHAVLDSVAYMGAGHPAKALLCELLRQHNGRNNGHLQLSVPWLKTRGWNSPDVTLRAKRVLLVRGLIVQCRQGGLNAGASLYALTWLPITNFVGLDIQAKDYHPGAWCLLDKLPPIKNARSVTSPVTDQYVSRICTDTSPVTDKALADTSPVSVKPLFETSTSTDPVNNECYQLPPPRTRRPVIGKKGKSGKRTPVQEAQA